MSIDPTNESIPENREILNSLVIHFRDELLIMSIACIHIVTSSIIFVRMFFFDVSST